MNLDTDPYCLVTEPSKAAPGSDGRLVELLAFAVLAPSPHNTQPWSWSIADGVVELRADRSRTLTISDPDGRELTIGCGAALEHYLLALAADGGRAETVVLPDPDDPDLLARVDTTRGAELEPSPELVDAMPRRRTNRVAYDQRPLPDGLLEVLSREANHFGIELHVVETDERTAVADLVMRGDREQMHDRAFRDELSSWMRRAGTHQHDGMPTDLLGQHGVAAEVAPLVVRTFDVGKGQAARDEALVDGSPGLVVLWSDQDSPAAWMRTGRAIARVTLRARAADVWSAYMNQPCEIPELRGELADKLVIPGSPQMFMRLGAGPDVHRSVRRPIDDVLTNAG